MRIVIMGLMVMGVTGCSLFDANSKVSVAQGRWQSFATSIPVIDLPPGMTDKLVQSYYMVPPARTYKGKPAKQHDGVFVPPTS